MLWKTRVAECSTTRLFGNTWSCYSVRYSRKYGGILGGTTLPPLPIFWHENSDLRIAISATLMLNRSSTNTDIRCSHRKASCGRNTGYIEICFGNIYHRQG